MADLIKLKYGNEPCLTKNLHLKIKTIKCLFCVVAGDLIKLATLYNAAEEFNPLTSNKLYFVYLGVPNNFLVNFDILILTLC